MTADPASGTRNRVVRGLARVLPGLALVAALVGCGSDADELTRSATEHSGNGATAVEPGPAPAEITPGPDRPEAGDRPDSESPSGSGGEPTPEAAAPEPVQVAEIRGTFSMQIPTLDVTAPVVPIEMTPDLVLEPPADPSTVGWWSEGAAPGSAEGSAVLVGHSVRTGGGALNEVGSLSDGDVIEVVGEEHTLTYEVETVEVLSKDELAREAERVFDQLGPGRLVVITCEDFDGTVWQSNVVATATLA